VPNFTDGKDIIGVKFKKTCHVTLIMPIKGSDQYAYVPLG